MPTRKIAIVLLALTIFGTANAAFAQDDPKPEKEKTILQRLDGFGKNLFGGILPADKSKPKSTAKDIPMPKAERPVARKPASLTQPRDDFDAPPSIGQRAGSVLAGAMSTARPPLETKPSDDAEFMPENTPPAVPRTTAGTPKPVRRPMANTSLFDDSGALERPATEPAGEMPSKPLTRSSEPIGEATELPGESKIVLRPLHERLAKVRQSPFEPGSTSETNSEPASRSEASAVRTVDSKPAMETRSLTSRPLVAQRTTPEVTVASPAAESVNTTPVAKAGEAAEEAHSAAQTEDDGGLLMTRKGPVLSVETLGPRKIMVGKESTYEVGIMNSGEVAADDLVIFVSLPEWAEVAGAQASSGAAQANVAGQGSETVQWKLGHLDAKGRERLTLRLIPRQSRPFDLAVRWEYKPVASQAAIEVQEPKLTLQLEGPREVLYGKREVYRLRLNNVGNGAAENVAIMLMPIGGGENVPASHRIGTLPAGEEKVLDVELTARQAGNLTIQVDARAEGGIRAELAEKVLVRRAGLKLDVEGPKVQFVGTAATYGIRVRNTGTAPARNVNLSIMLPAGAKYLAGIEGARIDAAGSKLEWTVETISPEVEQSFMLKCSMGAAGVSRVQVDAAADDDLTATTATVTRVESVANLTMKVKDPEGPVAVGEEAVYEVCVRNRGTREATGVEIFAYFSRGIEPMGAEGVPHRIGVGQVTFQPIPTLAPGAEVVLKVRARADVAGNHVFRAEAHCKPLGARLIREATNLYYTDALATQPASSEPAAEDPAPDTLRTVARPVQGQLTPVPPRK